MLTIVAEQHHLEKSDNDISQLETSGNEDRDIS
jgi:hypothetical protein